MIMLVILILFIFYIGYFRGWGWWPVVPFFVSIGLTIGILLAFGLETVPWWVRYPVDITFLWLPLFTMFETGRKGRDRFVEWRREKWEWVQTKRQ
jgi:hypothetical protein